ncbi:MAG: hypothetical protein WCD76_09190, partial [Pyrinomonadaceae bacterium]
MSRLPRTRRHAKSLLLLTAFFAAVLLIPTLWSAAGAQSSLPEPVVLPGDAGAGAAAGRQEQPQIAQGTSGYLAVWADARTAYKSGEAGASIGGLNVSNDNSGLGSMVDIYAARLDANGQAIDQTPIVVAQAHYDQNHPRVAWNGQNYLVAWYATRDDDRYTTDLLAARVSPAGVLLDQTPILIKSGVETWPANVITDASNNWVVVWEGVLPQEGTNIPRGVLVARVANNGTVLDPGGRVIYNHHNQFMGNPDLARAGDRYLLSFMTYGPPYKTWALTFDSNFNQLRVGPETIFPNGGAARVSSNGDTWLLVSGNQATRISRDGDPVGPVITLRPSNSLYFPGENEICWDGSNWQIAYTI